MNLSKPRAARLVGHVLPLLLAFAGHVGGWLWLFTRPPLPVAQAAPVRVRLLMASPLPDVPAPVRSAPAKPAVAENAAPVRRAPLLRKSAPPPSSAPQRAVTELAQAVARSEEVVGQTPAAVAPAAALLPPPPELAVQCSDRPAPAYPALARRRGWSGSVRLEITLAATGAVQAVQVAQSSGFAVLDAAAVAAVRRWRCRPALQGGQPVVSRAMQRIQFSLR